MNRIALLLGAGFSCPFGYPTTKQFFEKLDKKVKDQLQIKLLEAIKQNQEVKDVEHVLELLDILLAIDTNKYSRNLFESIITEIKLGSSSYKYGHLVNAVTALKSKIIDSLFDEYHFKPNTKDSAFRAIDCLAQIGIPECNIKDVFTLNYDRLMEEYFLARDITYIDGFSSVKNRRLWSPNVFSINEEDRDAPTRIFKLHGSLNWREWDDGTLECLPTEEPARNSYYKRNVYIYPTEFCDETTEPYLNLYRHFKTLKETSNILIIIGYAFRDEPINQIILDFLSQENKVVIAVSPTIIEDSKRFIKENDKSKNLMDSESEKERFFTISEEFPEDVVFTKIQNILS